MDEGKWRFRILLISILVAAGSGALIYFGSTFIGDLVGAFFLSLGAFHVIYAGWTGIRQVYVRRQVV